MSMDCIGIIITVFAVQICDQEINELMPGNTGHETATESQFSGAEPIGTRQG